ncbi:hypothetical protein GCM10010465_22450 [Actinomadura fibrosa]
MVITTVFVQCKNPKTDDTQPETQINSSTSEVPSQVEQYIDSSDVKDIDSLETNIDEPEPIVAEKEIKTEKPKSPVIDKKTTTEKPESPVVAKPETTVESPKPVENDKPTPVIVDKPQDKVVEKPEAPVNAAFTMKSVKATVQGTSSLHEWESNITKIEGKGTFELEDEVVTLVKDAEIKITVKGIISEKGDKMDKKTYETFNSDKYPYITYSFNNAAVKTNDSQAVQMDTNGTLSMAGVSKSVPISAVGKKLPNGDLHLTVSKKLKMTDFGMEPPVMLLGTIKVGDEVTVNFDFILAKS